MIRRILLVAVILGLSFNLSQAQNTYKADEVRLFQTFFQDTPIAAKPYGEGFFQYSNYDKLSSIDLAVQAAMPVADKIQVGGALGFRNLSPEVGDSQSGITDLLVSGRYNIMPGPTAISVGAFATLPIGSEDIGESSFDFSGFGSIRHHLPSGLAITGTLGLEFIETVSGAKIDFTTGEVKKETKHESGLLIAGGVIYPTKSGLNIVGELNIRTEGDYAFLTGALDYMLKSGGRVRGGIGIGLDNGAPDFALRAGYYLGF
ncbi:MAG: transporter [candidate division KSB1 bacterium]|nr:transporter [candidate division KSB1 bacterium]MDZ7301452.1 transporter [candidate division KSB1 bacterium]